MKECKIFLLVFCIKTKIRLSINLIYTGLRFFSSTSEELYICGLFRLYVYFYMFYVLCFMSCHDIFHVMSYVMTVVGLLVCWSWSVGLLVLVCWSVGLGVLVCWSVGLGVLVCGYVHLLICWW